MNKTALTLTSLVMTFVGLLFLAEVRTTINAAKENEQLAQFWKARVAREQLKRLIVMGQFSDFKQDVSLLINQPMRELKNKESKQKLRRLASVIPHETVLQMNFGLSAEKLLAKGKEQITQHSYPEGIKSLKKLIDKFPDSYHVVEAHYLIIEGYSRLERNQELIAWVDKMVELFPENRLTGYALLKVGSLYELDGRHNDAVRIYKTIVAVYDDQNLVAQAQVAVKELEL